MAVIQLAAPLTMRGRAGLAAGVVGCVVAVAVAQFIRCNNQPKEMKP